jgi:hypothetical protein
MKLEFDLATIKETSLAREDENWDFRSYLKWHDPPELDSVVRELFDEISAQIDCTQCGNCCRESAPVLSAKDVRRFAEGLGIPAEKFQAESLVPDEEKGKFRFSAKPCPFLKDNKCANYEHRPEDCRSFPHLHKRHFTTRLMEVIDSCEICPIVFNVYERLKDEVRWRR